MDNARQPHSQRPSRSRSRSRPRQSDDPTIHRLLSSQFPDDHSVYHHEDGEGLHIDADSRSLHKTETERRGSKASSSEDDESLNDVDESREKLKTNDEAAHREEKTYEEIRGGIPYEHDVEAPALPQMEKKKLSKSVQDPNLVSVPG